MTEDLMTKIEVLEVSEDETYGKFCIMPLERGYGTTLGNSLRRVLLSSLPGAAPTKIRIEGVLHELSKMDGVVEDVPEIILNIKELATKSYSDEPVSLRIDAEGPKEIKACDIQMDSQVEIANMDKHIATVDEGGELHMELIIEKGKGYRIYELNKSEDDPLDMIAVDSSFTPVHKVNYAVENTRVGQITDYDKLVLEVWTNGTITSQEAISQGAQILIEYLKLFSNLPDMDMEDESMNEKDNLDREKLLNTSIEDLDLSLRSFNCLKRAGIDNVGDIVERSLDEMYKIKNFGKKSLQEVEQKINDMGLSFADVDEE